LKRRFCFATFELIWKSTNYKTTGKTVKNFDIFGVFSEQSDYSDDSDSSGHNLSPPERMQTKQGHEG